MLSDAEEAIMTNDVLKDWLSDRVEVREPAYYGAEGYDLPEKYGFDRVAADFDWNLLNAALVHEDYRTRHLAMATVVRLLRLSLLPDDPRNTLKPTVVRSWQKDASNPQGDDGYCWIAATALVAIFELDTVV